MKNIWIIESDFFTFQLSRKRSLMDFFIVFTINSSLPVAVNFPRDDRFHWSEMKKGRKNEMLPSTIITRMLLLQRHIGGGSGSWWEREITITTINGKVRNRCEWDENCLWHWHLICHISLPGRQVFVICTGFLGVCADRNRKTGLHSLHNLKTQISWT